MIDLGWLVFDMHRKHQERAPDYTFSVRSSPKHDIVSFVSEGCCRTEVVAVQQTPETISVTHSSEYADGRGESAFTRQFPTRGTSREEIVRVIADWMYRSVR